MKTTLTLTASNGYIATFPVDLAKEEQVCSFLGGELQITRTENRHLPEFALLLTVTEPIALDRVSLSLPIAQTLGESAERVLIYNAGRCTNDFAQILKLSEVESLAMRGMFLARGENGREINFGFTSFDRFFTWIEVKAGEVTLLWNLENKVVRPGEVYALERLAADETLGGAAFCEAYTDLVAERYDVHNDKPVPAGWSSWSCLYNHINEEAIKRETADFAKEFLARGADLIQMDDGWEKGKMFDIFWTENPERFPSGLADLNRYIRSLGLRFGIWMAPGLINDESEAFDEFAPHLSYDNEGNAIRPRTGNPEATDVKNGSIYVMDIAQDYVKDMIANAFRRAKEEWGVEYFKIDFLVDMLYPAGDPTHPIVYQADYSVALFRELMRRIREAVGKETFLLSCGAPIGESIGYFDAVRVSPDITWGGAGSDWHPGAWNIMRMDAQNTLLRRAWHRKVFINDPDAVLLRDFANEFENDGLKLSLEEAKMWVSTVALSGGHALLNEQPSRISPERRALFSSILPPLGIAAEAEDFFEFPWCSEAHLRLCDTAEIVGLYNWGDEPMAKKVACEGRAVVVDCFTHEIFGVCEGEYDAGVLAPHTTKTFLLRKLDGKDGFLCADDGFFLGYNTVREKDGVMDCAREATVTVLAFGAHGAEEISYGGKRFERVENPFGLPIYERRF